MLYLFSNSNKTFRKQRSKHTSAYSMDIFLVSAANARIMLNFVVTCVRYVLSIDLVLPAFVSNHFTVEFDS